MGQVKWPPPTTLKASLWWDWKGVLYYELLPENQTINSNKYCSQLDQLKAALDKKCLKLINRPRIIFHQDNTRLHVSLMTRQKLLQLGWEVLIPPPYSPFCSTTFCHFWSNFINPPSQNFLSFWVKNCLRCLLQISRKLKYFFH